MPVHFGAPTICRPVLSQTVIVAGVERGHVAVAQSV